MRISDWSSDVCSSDLRCAVALAHMIERAGLVGVGSMCRRPVHGADGLIAVVDRLDQVPPRQTRMHLFGVKGAAIPYLTAFAHRIASIDSQAYEIGRASCRDRVCKYG